MNTSDVVFDDPAEAAKRDYRGNAAESAAAKGLVVVVPTETQLFLDIDTELSMLVFLRNLPILSGLVETHVIKPSQSAGKHKFHITLELSRPVQSNFERIMLQALLGSDLWHEALSWKAASLGVENPTLFFEKP